MRKGWLFFTAFFLCADRFTKYLASTYIQGRPGDAMAFLPGLVRFRYVENTGAAFSALSGMQGLLIAVAAAVIAAVALYLFRSKSLRPVLTAGLCLIAAGGLGNLLDRILWGHVVDFIEFVPFQFAIFNVADICISLGAAAVFLHLFVTREKHGRDDVHVEN